MNDARLRTIGVAVPAHDEEAVLPACLGSIFAAAAAVDLPVRVVVALDRCQDGSADAVAQARAAGLDVRTTRPAHPGVGAARAAAIHTLLSDLDPASTWLATTDADSRVPSHWLTGQLAHAACGADVVVGTVRVSDWSEHQSAVRERYLAGYRPWPGHRHMHGANLSFRASRYLAIGGFAPLRSDEDVKLIGQFEQANAALVWAADIAVDTSARRIGRAPSGFADFLSGLEEVT